MGDDVLRSLERTYERTGDATDGRRWLAELERRGEAAQALRVRVRLGDLDPERLQLAAWAGHAAAQAAVGGSPPPVDLEAWAEGLWRWGQSACVRAVLAAAGDARGDAIEAARAWLGCPDRERSSEASALSGRPDLVEWEAELLDAIGCPPRTAWVRMRGTWQGCRHHIDALVELAAQDAAATRATAERSLATWALAPATACDAEHLRHQLAATYWDAIHAGDVEVISATLDRDCPVDQRLFSDTPLNSAVTANQVGVVALLLERGADVEAEVLGLPPLARARSVEVAELLLRRGAKPTPAVLMAVCLEDPLPSVVRCLLMAGASPDAIDPRTGRSAREARPTLFKKLGLPAAPKRPRREAD